MSESTARSQPVAFQRDAVLADVEIGQHALAWAYGFGLTLVLVMARGGYFPEDWGLLALGLAWIAAFAMTVRSSIRLGLRELVWIGLVTLFASWIALSLLWTSDFSQTMLEIERAVLYLLGAVATLVVLRRQTVGWLLGGLLSGLVVACVYGLGSRLFPERIGTFDAIAAYRLDEPVGYWNAMGILAVLGILLGLGFSARTRSRAFRVAAAATLPIFASTLYFTFSRGAMLVLPVALAVMFAVDRSRLRTSLTLLVAMPMCFLAVWVGWREPALTHRKAPLAEAAREGHRVALYILFLCFAAGFGVFLLSLAKQRITVPRSLQLAYAGALLLAVGALVVATFVHFGSPSEIAHRVQRAFETSSTGVGSSGNLNERLLNFTGNGRAEAWRVALRQRTENPWLGSGAGTYEQYWYRYRPESFGSSKTRDAHSLYLETLGELGPAGLALLLVGLALPIAAGVKARRRRFVPATLGAYSAFLLHAGVDWDWEMPAVALIGLTCAAVLLVAARSETAVEVRSRARVLAILAMVPLVGLSLVGLVGNGALAASLQDRDRGLYRKAEREARDAISWAPWSADPLQELGRSQYEKGDVKAARMSFRRALAKEPQEWELWLDLALTSEGPQLRNALLRASALNPNDRDLAKFRADVGLE